MSRSVQLRRGRASRGYTLVELMMALALFTVAMLGIISMQKLMAVSNGHAKNVSIAQRIAQSWAAQLALDAATWRDTKDTTDWLKEVGTGWKRPTHVAGAKNFGAAFDAVGNPLTDNAGVLTARARFCTHVRLTWLYEDAAANKGNGMMRAEVRVFWLRDGESDIDAAGICKSDVSVPAVGQAYDRYHFVYHTTGVRQGTSS
jgi:prepilin-type N-terminal cleavage/methylation domain-containing protein